MQKSGILFAYILKKRYFCNLKIKSDMDGQFKYFLNLLFSKERRSEERTDVNDRLVAAGDPAKPLTAIAVDIPISSAVRERVHGLEPFKVCGSSMSPCGISNGDIIYGEDIKTPLKRNDFIVVEVDPKVYDSPIKYRHKLRRYLMDVEKHETLDSVIKRLSVFHKEILEPEFVKRLEKKYDKTTGQYPDDDFCLSITFRNGDLRYSFHPRRLVEYKVKFVVSSETNALTDADTIAAY